MLLRKIKIGVSWGVLLWGLGFELASAQRLIIGRQDGQAQGDCRVKPTDLVPVIHRYNPFFSDHDWRDDIKVETARMSSARHLTIEQKGCTRHHKVFTLNVSPAVCKPTELSFFALEVFNLFNRVYFNNLEFWNIRRDFEAEMLRKLPAFGLGNQFDFQIAEFTFICEFNYFPKEGAVIKVEEVNLVHEHKLRLPGVPEYDDDGWFVAPKVAKSSTGR